MDALITIFRKYRILCRTSHLIIDLLTAFAFAALIFFFGNIPLDISSITKIFLPILTFLAGLQSTSLIFFANSNSDLITKLKEEHIVKNHIRSNIPKIHQLYAYFAWAVSIQFGTILLSLVANFLSINTTAFVYFILFAGFYSIILCIRNVGIFFLVLMW